MGFQSEAILWMDIEKPNMKNRIHISLSFYIGCQTMCPIVKLDMRARMCTYR